MYLLEDGTLERVEKISLEFETHSCQTGYYTDIWIDVETKDRKISLAFTKKGRYKEDEKNREQKTLYSILSHLEDVRRKSFFTLKDLINVVERMTPFEFKNVNKLRKE